MKAIDWVSDAEPFTYVFFGTSGLEVNLGPLRALGWRRIDRIILLVGAGSNPTALDRRNALEPAERFGEIVEYNCENLEIPIETPKIVRVPGQPDRTYSWYEHLLLRTG